jgi:hypothetical protein
VEVGRGRGDGERGKEAEGTDGNVKGGGSGKVEVDWEKVGHVMRMIGRMFGEGEVDEGDLKALVAEAYEVTDSQYVLRDAIKWGEGFVWPEEVRGRDWQRVLSAGSLEAAVADRHREMSGDRLSRERVDRWVERTDGDRDRLLGLCGGMNVFVDESFVPNGRPPPMRAAYKQAAGAVNKLLLELWEADLVFIIPTCEAVRIPGIHFSPAHWAKKTGKRGGRNIFDSRDDTHGNAINSEGGKERIIQEWGEIEHPTISDLVQMIFEFAEEAKSELRDGFAWEEVVLWKADLAKAFTLLNFKPEDVSKLACELTDGLTLVYHTGLFGWTGTPYAFQVVTRALESALRRCVKGRLCMYVDDIMGVAMRGWVEEVKERVREVVSGLLGSKALAEDKWELGRKIDWLGWRVDLDDRVVSIKRVNFLRALYGFFEVDEGSKVKVRTVERLGSYAARYSTVLRHMRPFTSAIYSQIQGMNNRECSKSLDRLGKLAVRVWRVILCMLDLKGPMLARSLKSFVQRVAEVEVRFDASLEGIGVSVWRIGDREPLGVLSATFPFCVSERSQFQNTVEFIAVVIGCVCLVRRGFGGALIKLVGDNRTSLKWGLSERFKGTLALGASLAYVIIGCAFDLWVVEAVHVAGVENEIHDKMSRGCAPEFLGFKEEVIMRAERDEVIAGWLKLCDPTVGMGDVGEFERWWGVAQGLVRRLQG